jgi:hypothetical protein
VRSSLFTRNGSARVAKVGETRSGVLSSTIWWMIPLPGPQNSMPYFFAADSRKSKTSLLLTMALCKQQPQHEPFLPFLLS